ncbi:hypothetical protein HUO13_34945 [Saccharopolyspora erythraea]|uniref:hypothetical protein n=1 Tax=Saccharopolyspora erythraea TaxID=1836 RepID=UPI001BABCC0A|nr:hypothetical protein [Saccharopolyspora erythraea]QUH05286.1 hypothetical protein HUO13_34945 [Saccharopolyspora erythraea]
MNTTPDRDGPPRQLLVAILLWWVVAALVVVRVAGMWLDRAEMPARLVRQGAVVPEHAAQRAWELLTLNTAVQVLFVLVYCATTLLIRKRRPWARIVLTVCGLLHLVVTMSAGISNLPLAVGLVAALVLLWWPVSGEWLTGEHD